MAIIEGFVVGVGGACGNNDRPGRSVRARGAGRVPPGVDRCGSSSREDMTNRIPSLKPSALICVRRRDGGVFRVKTNVQFDFNSVREFAFQHKAPNDRPR